jgi:hypothetical protein
MEPTEACDLVTTLLTDLGFGDATSLSYFVVDHRRHFAGNCFDFEGEPAIRLADTRPLSFVDGTGKLLKNVRLDKNEGVVKKAA